MREGKARRHKKTQQWAAGLKEAREGLRDYRRSIGLAEGYEQLTFRALVRAVIAWEAWKARAALERDVAAM